MYVATERETSDNTEATRFSQCAHDQRRRLEAEDCNSIRCAQLISGGRRRIRPCPPHCLAHARPTMCCIRLVTSKRSRGSKFVTCGGAAPTADIYIYIWSRHARWRRPADSHVYVCTVLLACWLTTYVRFCYEHGYYRIFAEQR